jgi:PKD repeat protein
MSSLILARRPLLCAVLLSLVLPVPLGAGSQSRPWRIAYDACVAVAGPEGYEPYCEIHITDDESESLTLMAGVRPVWSTDGLRVAAAHGGDIYLGTLADRSIVNLTLGAGGNAPRWSPDNARIAFSRSSYGALDLYVMNADGSAQTRLTQSAGVRGEFAWAPDGTALAFIGTVDNVPELFVVRMDGSAPARLTYSVGVDTGSVAIEPSAPSWSHDGARIAFDCANDVCAVGADGTGLIRLTNEPQGAFGGMFSPVDGKIAVALGQSGALGIGVIGLDGVLTAVSPGQRAGQHAWSPTGESLAFVIFDNGSYVCPADGSCLDGRYDTIHTVNSDGTELSAIALGHNPRWAGSLPGQPVATFTRACASTQCQFDATGSSDPDGSIASYLWKFGDGTTSAESAPLHTYARTGVYEVTLIVGDATGSTAVALKSVVANTPPTASFTVVCNGPTCTFDGSASTDPDGTIAHHAWMFGDDGSGGGTTATHTYPAGTFTARLVVTDEAGSMATADQTVTVVNALPVASFTVACTGLTCTFDATGSYDEDGAIQYYLWEFGPTISHSYQRIASHTYSRDGAYTVTLTVWDDAGQRSTASRTVTVTVPPPPGISYMHVGDLDRSSTTLPKTWNASATIAVHTENHGPVAGVAVSGSWNDGTAASCTTDVAGKCVFARSNLSRKTNSVTLTITNAAHATMVYKPAGNHDPDGDSNGTVITIPRQ